MCLKLEWYKTISMWMTLYHTHVCADVVEKYIGSSQEISREK